MSLQGATGAVTGVVGAVLPVIALGYALNFVGQAFDRVPDYRGNTRRSKPVFDTRQPKKKMTSSYNVYGGGNQNNSYDFGGNGDYGNYGDYEGYGSYGNGMNGYTKKKKQQLSSDDMFDLSRYF